LKFKKIECTYGLPEQKMLDIEVPLTHNFILRDGYITHNSVVFASQTFRIDTMIRDLADIIWFKPFFALDMEKDILKKSFVELVRFVMPTAKNENLVWNMQEMKPYIFSNPLPSRWNMDISKAFGILPLSEQRKMIALMSAAGIDDKTQARMLAIRGGDLDLLGKEDTM